MKILATAMLGAAILAAAPAGAESVADLYRNAINRLIPLTPGQILKFRDRVQQNLAASAQAQARLDGEDDYPPDLAGERGNAGPGWKLDRTAPAPQLATVPAPCPETCAAIETERALAIRAWRDSRDHHKAAVRKAREGQATEWPDDLYVFAVDRALQAERVIFAGTMADACAGKRRRESRRETR